MGKARLKAMVDTGDSVEIALHEPLICGPGEFMGVRQSGAAQLRRRLGVWAWRSCAPEVESHYLVVSGFQLDYVRPYMHYIGHVSGAAARAASRTR
jgi:hypothetical protein